MDNAAFKRDRLQAAIGKLRERLAELKDQEENARRQVAYDKAEAARDELANELADLYPAFAQKLAELLPRIAANDREIEYINGYALPSGAERLLVAELVARGLEGFVQNSWHLRASWRSYAYRPNVRRMTAMCGRGRDR
jgi:transposase